MGVKVYQWNGTGASAFEKNKVGPGLYPDRILGEIPPEKCKSPREFGRSTPFSMSNASSKVVNVL